LYDKYDQENDKIAVLLFYESLCLTVHDSLQKKDKDSNLMFLEVVANFLQVHKQCNLTKMEQLNKKLKSIHPLQYPQQNLHTMSEDLIDLADCLVSAGQYTHDLIHIQLE